MNSAQAQDAPRDLHCPTCGSRNTGTCGRGTNGVRRYKCRDCYKRFQLVNSPNKGNLVHGHTRHDKRSPTYISWQSMIARCYNPKLSEYKFYGAKGITVCDKWREFKGFVEDMGERPEGKTIDRFPNGRGNYEPGNCRWATMHEQQNNRSSNHIIEMCGERLSLSEWDSKLGFYPGTVYQRLRRGWTIEKAVTLPRLEDHRNDKRLSR